MPNIVVYSCVAGQYDNLFSTLFRSKPKHEEGVKYIVFVDDVETVTRQGIWEIRPLFWKHSSSYRRSSRWHKTNPQILFPEADYTVWIDGSQVIKPVNIFSDLVEPYTKNVDIATFKHPIRNCVYQELAACKQLKKDDPSVMDNQIQFYKKVGYRPGNGMVETACVVRKHTDAVANFNRKWWEQLESNSYRDQLSFNYVSWLCKIPYGHIPGHRAQSPFFDFVMHQKR